MINFNQFSNSLILASSLEILISSSIIFTWLSISFWSSKALLLRSLSVLKRIKLIIFSYEISGWYWIPQTLLIPALKDTPITLLIEFEANNVEFAGKDTFKYLYEDKLSLFKKIEKIAQEIYHASEVVADTKVRQQLKEFEEKGYGNLPVCIAKTQYSFSTDPNLKGAPTGHVLPVREVRLSSGAEFVVVVCGEIMTMPGLPRVPAADSIKLNDEGEIEGLF